MTAEIMTAVMISDSCCGRGQDLKMRGVKYV